MNAATQTKIANSLTSFAALITIVQTSITVPPFTARGAEITGGALVLASILVTYLKQHLSADVSTRGKNLTLLLIGLPALLTGAVNFIGLFTFSETTSHWITWAISLLLMIVNIQSKWLFPSGFQKDKVDELKTIDKTKTE